MCGSNKFSASVTSGVLMSLFLHSRVADSRMARASETVMVFAVQKVCHAANDVALRSCRVFSSITSCMCVISRQDQRRNSDTGSKKGDTFLAATGRKIAGKTEESSGGRLSTSLLLIR